jgi:hypothetical protein
MQAAPAAWPDRSATTATVIQVRTSMDTLLDAIVDDDRPRVKDLLKGDDALVYDPRKETS